jgi:1,6-anhydro-N-acetylmuramate kinase
MEESRYILGCMTGTSIDGIDVAAVKVTGNGLSLAAKFLGHVGAGLGELEAPLRAFASQQPATARDIALLARKFSLLHADVCKKMWEKLQAELRVPHVPHLISVHGQTVFHQPPASWQLFQPAPLALLMNCPVVCDLRAADIAAGGQGAPLTPLADYFLFARPDSQVTILNLGGFLNYSILPMRTPGLPLGDVASKLAEIRGGDVFPCNHLLDAISRKGFGKPFDEGGKLAMSGRVYTGLLDSLDMFAPSHDSPRSLGTGDELTQWVDQALQHHSPQDAAATACAAIARAVRRKLTSPGAILLFGGAARHRRLCQELENAIGREYFSTTTMPPDAREAAGWAVLGALAADGVAVGLEAVTRTTVTPRLAGVWTY